jgi:hypothetical protein
MDRERNSAGWVPARVRQVRQQSEEGTVARVWLWLADDDRSPDGYDGLMAAAFELEVLRRVRAELPAADRAGAGRAVQLMSTQPLGRLASQGVSSSQT